MTAAMALPRLIQGGMGVGVSNWCLAAAVTGCGQLGVVSGTGLDTLFVRRLQDGDLGGHLRRAMAHFPLPEVVTQVLEKYFRPEGRRADAPYRSLARYELAVGKLRQQITVLANFVEVHLAREAGGGPVGINLLTKIQLPNLASLYGAMLAGVDWVLMGAGIPREIPRALDELAAQRPATLQLDVEGETASGERILFDPAACGFDTDRPLARPRFLPIVASNSLATMLARKCAGGVDGLVVELPVAGGHNAPPRGELQINQRGEPVYGERDRVDLDRIAALGLPFWLAGGYGTPAQVEAAMASGAAGVQVGTLFAWCRESGIADELKRQVIAAALGGQLDVVTDAVASPTGFPFKVVQLPGTISEAESYARRSRVCDLGYLRSAVRLDGEIAWRCAAEPVADFVAKGGEEAGTVGRKCLCNALLATAGHPQQRPRSEAEAPLLTSGDELRELGGFLAGRTDYGAADVVAHLLAPVSVPS